MSPQSRPRRPKKPAKPAENRDRPSRSPAKAETPAASARYTPRVPVIRFRPTSHKVTGWVLVGLGILIAVLNDVARIGPRVVPGGHSELYLLLAVAVAASGGWWLGIFDRPS